MGTAWLLGYALLMPSVWLCMKVEPLMHLRKHGAVLGAYGDNRVVGENEADR